MRILLLSSLLALSACAGPIAARVVRAPNHELAERIPWWTSGIGGFGGAERSETQGVRVRRMPVAGGTISLRVTIIEPGAPFVITQETWFKARRAWSAPPTTPAATVVILHGLWGDSETIAAHGAALANAGFRVVLIDLRGHGESTGDTISFGKNEAADVSDVLRGLRAEGEIREPVALLGYSYGAAVALIAAGRGADVATVVAVAPFARLGDVAPNFSKRFAGWLDWLVTPSLTRAVIREAGRRGGFDPVLDSPLQAAPQITVPVLLIHGAKDDLVPPAQSALIAAQLRGEHQRVLIPDQDHINEVLEPGLSLPTALPWLVAHLAPNSVLGITGGVSGWVGDPHSPLRATWAFRTAPSDWSAPWPRPAGGRNIRTWFRVPPAWLGRDLMLDLGSVPGDDETWLGPMRLGGMHERQPLPLPLFRRYRMPAWALSGTNELTINLTCHEPNQGLIWAGGGVALVKLASPAGE